MAGEGSRRTRWAVLGTTFVAAAAAMCAIVGWQTATARAGVSPCAEKVLRDWTDNGRVDGLYPSKCYVDAIASLPEDVRTYSSAVDDISRAMEAAQRGGSAGAGKNANSQVRRLSSEEARQIASQTPSTVDTGHPPALLAVIAIAGIVAISGLAAYLLRRWRDVP